MSQKSKLHPDQLIASNFFGDTESPRKLGNKKKISWEPAVSLESLLESSKRELDFLDTFELDFGTDTDTLHQNQSRMQNIARTPDPPIPQDRTPGSTLLLGKKN